MGAVSYRLRAEFRTRWKSAGALALVAGIAGAVTLAAVAGARRTTTAFERFRSATDAEDILVNPDNGAESALRSEAVARLPGVAAAAKLTGLAVFDPFGRTLEEVFGPIALASDRAALVTIGRPKLLEGRIPKPHHADEILVDRTFVTRYGLGVGDTWRVAAATNRAPQVDISMDLVRQIRRRMRDHTLEGEFLDLRMRIVGVGIIQSSILTDQGFENPWALFSPEFLRRHPTVVVPYWAELVRFRPGANVGRFQRRVEALVPGEAVAFQTIANTRAKVERAVRPQSGALGAFAIVVGLTGLLVIAQTLVRQTTLDAVDHAALRAIGASRRQLFLLAMGRTVPASFVAALIAVLGAFALSPLTPIGAARVAEPDPGFAFNTPVLLLGALALLVVILLIETIPAWRTSRSMSDTAPTSRPSRISGLLATTGASPVIATGVRMALEPGAGRTAVPVRTTIASAFFAIAAVTGAVVVAASLNHLVDTPGLYGWNWDVSLQVSGEDAVLTAANQRAAGDLLAGDPAVAHSSTLALSAVEIDGHQIPAVGIDPRHPRPGPSMPEGRAPRTGGEIALGARTQRSLGVGIGDRVTVVDQAGKQGLMRVVGRVVLPGLGTYSGSDKTSPGEGAVVTQTALRRLGPDFGRNHILVDFRAGTTGSQQAAVIRNARAASNTDDVIVSRALEPSDVLAYRDVRSTPIVLSTVLALLAMMTLAHGLISSVRRRRRELALLKTLGFTRRQVSSTVAWHASTVVAVALLFGIPLGIAVGRWAWTALANDLGTVVVPVVPWVIFALAIPALLLVANVVAYIPGRIAARLRPATALRGE